MEEAERLQKLPTYIFAKQDKLKAEARKRGADLIDLGLGSPDIPPPKEVVTEMITALKDPANHRYPPFDGSHEGWDDVLHLQREVIGKGSLGAEQVTHYPEGAFFHVFK